MPVVDDASQVSQAAQVANASQIRVSLVRLAEHARDLYRLHEEGTDEQIDWAFGAICRSIWGYTLDDFDDDMLSEQDHAWLDRLTKKRAQTFAAQNGYDLTDHVHGGIVTDWWGFAWMILAEKRGLLTPQTRALAWSKYEARLRAGRKVIGFVGRR